MKYYKGMDESHQVYKALHDIVPPNVLVKDILFLCIGTDRSTGDSLGPLVGSYLSKKRISHLGNLDNPVHGMNLSETKIPKNKFVIAIDACLGQVSSVGYISMSDKPLKPGAGVNKDLGEWGHASITGIVNVGGFMEYFVLQNTRLSLVMRMQETIGEGIVSFIKCKRETERKLRRGINEVSSIRRPSRSHLQGV
jgi:putative sporulation protein YyaC